MNQEGFFITEPMKTSVIGGDYRPVRKISERFKNAFAILTPLAHPNITRVHDFDRDAKADTLLSRARS